MLIAKQVRQLPEIGDCLIRDADKFDARQRAIDEMQAELNADRMQYLHNLREDWKPEELTGAGLFF